MARNARNLTIAVLAMIIGLASIADVEAGRFGSRSRSGGGNRRSFGGGNHRNFGGGHNNRHRSWGHQVHKHFGHKHHGHHGHHGHKHHGHHDRKHHFGHKHHGNHKHFAHRGHHYRWNYYNHYRGFCQPCHYQSYTFAPPAPVPFVATAGPAPAAPAPIAPVEIAVGTWTANPANNVTIVLSFGADSQFQWQQTIEGQNSSFTGSYAMENGTLNLTRSDSQQTLIGTVSITEGGFNFKLQNGDPNDPGLNFIR